MATARESLTRRIRPNASLGFPRMAYQKPDVAMSACEPDKFAPIRLAGATSRARTALLPDLAQHAKSGCCPRCTFATRLAPPPTSPLGESDPLKVRGLALLGTHEP